MICGVLKVWYFTICYSSQRFSGHLVVEERGLFDTNLTPTHSCMWLNVEMTKIVIEA